MNEFSNGNKVVYLSIRNDVGGIKRVKQRLEGIAKEDSEVLVFYKGNYVPLIDVVGDLNDLRDDANSSVEVREKGDKEVCAVVRYFGGLGDIISMHPAVVSLTRLFRKVYLAIPLVYHFLFKHERIECLDLDFKKLGGKLISNKQIFEQKYCGVYRECGKVFDAYCPAMGYEIASKHRPEKSRAHCFASFFGVPFRPPRIDFGKLDASSDLSRPVVGINLNSSNVSKNWHISRIREFCGRMKEKHSIHVISFDEGVTISEAFPFAGHSLPLLCKTIASLDCMVSTDTGTLHVAGASGVKLVGLFGPTSGKVTTSVYDNVRVLQCLRENNCHRPCHFGSENGYRCQNRVGDCMNDIAVVDVEEAVRCLLDR